MLTRRPATCRKRCALAKGDLEGDEVGLAAETLFPSSLFHSFRISASLHEHRRALAVLLRLRDRLEQSRWRGQSRSIVFEVVLKYSDRISA